MSRDRNEPIDRRRARRMKNAPSTASQQGECKTAPLSLSAGTSAASHVAQNVGCPDGLEVQIDGIAYKGKLNE